MAYMLKLPNHWLIHNEFHVSLLKPYKGEPPHEPIHEDPPEIEGQEETLQPECILQHEDKVLRNGKTTRRYLVNSRTIPLKMRGGCKTSNSKIVNTLSMYIMTQLSKFFFNALC